MTKGDPRIKVLEARVELLTDGLNAAREWANAVAKTTVPWSKARTAYAHAQQGARSVVESIDRLLEEDSKHDG